MIIVITGPTGVGKTKLSIELAKRLNGEIINADSTQVYRNLDIATAKIKPSEMDGIPHHLFDIKDITEKYTIYDYQNDSRLIIDNILKKNKTPILVGGSGLYIKSSLYDYQFEDENFNDFNELSNEQIYDQLIKLDHKIDIHINNRKRLIRALNYCLSTNKKFSEKEKDNPLLYNVLFVGLTTKRDVLYDRINKRVDQMIEDGLVQEAKKIYDSQVRTKAVLTPIGYKELFPFFDGVESLENCINEIKKRSRHYAKKQYTWFNNQMNIKWFEVNFDDFNDTINKVLNFIKSGE